MKKAVILMIFASLAYSVMAALVKLIATQVPNTTIVFARFFVSFIYVLTILLYRYLKKRPITLKTKCIKFHGIRTTAAIINMLLFYQALTYIPILDATLLNTTYPLFIPVLASIFLKTHTHLKVWIGISMGFIGVIFVIHPTHLALNYGSMLALGSGLSLAFAFLALRQISKHDHVYTTMFHFFSVATVISGILAIAHWKTPSLYATLILIAVGISATVFQECLTRASVYAPARITSSLMYINVIFSGLLGWLIWGNIPDLYRCIGIVLVCVGAVITIFYANKTKMYTQIKDVK